MSLGKISPGRRSRRRRCLSVGDKLPEINNALVVYKMTNKNQKSFLK